MSSTSGVNRPSHPPLGIVAPKARVQIGVEQGNNFEIRPREPLNLWISQRAGASLSLELAAKPSAYVIEPSTLPPGQPAPRGPGSWFKISLAPGAQPSGKEEVRVQSKAVVKGPVTPHTELTFTLSAGGARLY